MYKLTVGPDGEPDLVLEFRGAWCRRKGLTHFKMWLHTSEHTANVNAIIAEETFAGKLQLVQQWRRSE